MDSRKSTILNGKHFTKTKIQLQSRKVSLSSNIPNICVIQQAFFQSDQQNIEQKIADIKKSIGDKQGQIYYSMYKINSQEQCNNEKKETKFENTISYLSDNNKDVNIILFKQNVIDNQFNQKLHEFQIYKIKQLERIAQLKDYKQNQALFDWMDKLMIEENQELRYQVFSLYSVLKNTQNQSFYSVVLLYQNFHPKYNLLLHSSSIIQSIFCLEYEQNQILDFPKFVYINLTGHESDDNFQFWKDLNYYYQNFCLYFSICHGNNQKQFQSFNRQTIIPYQNDIIQEFEMKIIFNLYIKNKLIQFKPAIIYVDICNTEQFQINLTALDKLLKKLRKFGKVVSHIKYDMKSQTLEKQSLEFMRTINACLFGLQRIQKIGKKESLNQEKLTNSIKFIEQHIQLIQKQNHLSNYLQIQKYCLKKKLAKITYLKSQFKFILIGEKQNYLIEAQSLKKEKIQFERLVISYQHKIIILLDFNNQKFYYHCFKNLSTHDNDILNQEIFLFTELKENRLFQRKIINAIVIINEQQILFAYPIIKNQDNLNKNDNQYDNLKGNEDIILSYCLDKDNWQIIERDQNDNNLNIKEYFEDRDKTQQLIKQLREYKIVGQTVCYQPHILDKEGWKIYSLFGGEIIDSFKPMNLIEYLFINVQNNYFYSKFIRRRTNPYEGTLKPSPYQLVLPIKNLQQIAQNNEIHCAYLILRPWNQTKNNYYETMLNPQNLTKAQLAIYQKNDKFKDIYRTIFIDIDYVVSKNSKYRLNILEMMNEDVNWIEIEDQNEPKSQINKNQWKWKAVYTNYMKIKNLQYLTQDDKKDDDKNDHDISNGTFVSLEFIISLNYKQNDKSKQKNSKDSVQVVQSKQSNDEINHKQFNKEIQKQESNSLQSAQQNLYQTILSFSSEDWSVQTEIFWEWILEQKKGV